MNVRLEPHEHGTILPVRAQPGARRNGLRGIQGGALKVSVTQVAEKGKANSALAAVLAKELALRKGQFELVAGPTSAQKRFLVTGIEPAELAARIQAALEREPAP